MKKILAVAAMAAMVAGAAFAADVGAKVQLDGELFNVGTDGKVKGIMLKEYDPSGDSDYVWKMTASGDNFGAELWSWSLSQATVQEDGSLVYDSVISSKKIWVQPLDFLKVTVGNVGGQSIAFPNFGWWAQSIQNYSYGYQADLTFGDLSATIALEPGAGTYWIDTTATNLFGGKIGGTWLAVKYGLGDWGTVQAIASINATVGAHGFSNWATTPLAFAVAYNHMPYGQTGFYADAVVGFNYNGEGKLAFQGVDAQIGGQFVSGAIKVMETNLIQYRDAFKFGFDARVEYSLGSITPYIYIDGYSIMNDTAAVTFEAGASTSVGSVSMYAGVQVPVTFSDSYKFSLSVPCQFSVAF